MPKQHWWLIILGAVFRNQGLQESNTSSPLIVVKTNNTWLNEWKDNDQMESMFISEVSTLGRILHRFSDF